MSYAILIQQRKSLRLWLIYRTYINLRQLKNKFVIVNYFVEAWPDACFVYMDFNLPF